MCFLVVATLLPSSAFAQPGVVSGAIADASGVPVTGATVSLSGTSSITTTDQDGQFRLTVTSPGAVKLSVRRLGFSPVSRDFAVKPGQTLRDLVITMPALPGMLNPVFVRANRVEYQGRLAGYYQRLARRSGGYFIPRDQIDKKSYRNLSQLLRAVPGVNAFPMKSGGGTVRMRERDCRPLVWLDGVPMPAAEVDLDAIPASTLHGIEAYPGSSTTPHDFVQAGLKGCGTIVLWSRGPDTDPLVQRSNRPVDLELLIASLKAFSGDQVDRRAVLKGEESLELIYPPELLAEGLSGSVLAEFIVDSTGVIEGETVSIVSSSHPLFTAAVVKALRSAAYVPAIKSDKPVRQVVQQPFSFVPGRGRAAQAAR